MNPLLSWHIPTIFVKVLSTDIGTGVIETCWLLLSVGTKIKISDVRIFSTLNLSRLDWIYWFGQKRIITSNLLLFCFKIFFSLRKLRSCYILYIHSGAKINVHTGICLSCPIGILFLWKKLPDESPSSGRERAARL